MMKILWQRMLAKIRQWRTVTIYGNCGDKSVYQADQSDDEYRVLQVALVSRPGLGDLIPGSGGLRKVRWNTTGQGKRGGVRVIYYWVVDDEHIRMLYVYPKGKQANLTQTQLKQLRNIIERW